MASQVDRTGLRCGAQHPPSPLLGLRRVRKNLVFEDDVGDEHRIRPLHDVDPAVGDHGLGAFGPEGHARRVGDRVGPKVDGPYRGRGRSHQINTNPGRVGKRQNL